MGLDEIDFKAIEYLMHQGRITWSELASLLELSAPAAADRVRRLEERKVIQGYTARINPEAVGCELLAFITVSLERPQHRTNFLQMIQTTPEVQECHHVTGEDDFWLKVRCRNTKALEHLITAQIKSIVGVSKTRTTIVLSTLKETSALPLQITQD